MQELHYERPTDVADAVALLARDGARALAGGTDLIPQLREGRRAANRIVDLKHVPELNEITRTADGGWRIGGAVSVMQLSRHAEFAAEHAALLASARLIGSLQIQSRATLAGNLCNAAPSADAVPLLIAMGAIVEIASADGVCSRTGALSIANGPGRTSLAPGDLVTALLLPAVEPRTAACYLRFTPRREMDIAIAGAGVVLKLGDDGVIQNADIVLASVAPVPLRVKKAELLLIRQKPSAQLFIAAAAAAATEARPISDTRGSAEYRRELVAVLTRRALADCVRQLGVSLS